MVLNINYDDLQTKLLALDLASFIWRKCGQGFVEELDKDKSRVAIACPRFIMHVVHVAAGVHSMCRYHRMIAQILHCGGTGDHRFDILDGSVLRELTLTKTTASFCSVA